MSSPRQYSATSSLSCHLCHGTTPPVAKAAWSDPQSSLLIWSGPLAGRLRGVGGTQRAVGSERVNQGDYLSPCWASSISSQLSCKNLVAFGMKRLWWIEKIVFSDLHCYTGTLTYLPTVCVWIKHIRESQSTWAWRGKHTAELRPIRWLSKETCLPAWTFWVEVF